MGARSTIPANTTSNTEASPEVALVHNELPNHRLKDGIIESISRLWMSGRHTDLVVVVDKCEINCHRFILGACSDYFANLLSSRHVETGQMRITFKTFSRETFETILEILYTGRDLITSINIQDVWHASRELKIHFLFSECEEFNLKHLNVENFADIHKYAAQLESTRVLQATSEMIENNFLAFTESQTFFELTCDDFLKIINNNKLAVASEDIVIDSILKWIEYVSFGRRNGFIGKLLLASRLSLVSERCLAMLTTRPILKQDLDATLAYDRAILYQLYVGHRHGQWPSTAVHRRISEFENVVVAGSDDGNVYALRLPDHHQLYHLTPSSDFNDCYVTLSVFDNKLYTYASQRAHCIFHSETPPSRENMQNNANEQMNIVSKLYVLKESRWELIASVPGVEHILVSHGEFIYFFHRTNQKVLKQKPYEDAARISVADVPSKGYIVNAFPFEIYILVFSQMPESLLTTTMVHCLNTSTGNWYTLRDLNGPAQMISFKNDRGTFILQTNGNVNQICMISDKVELTFVDRLWNFNWQLTGSVHLGDTLFICGRGRAASTSSATLTRDKNNRKLCITNVADSIRYIDAMYNFYVPAILSKNMFPN